MITGTLLAAMRRTYIDMGSLCPLKGKHRTGRMIYPVGGEYLYGLRQKTSATTLHAFNHFSPPSPWTKMAYTCQWICKVAYLGDLGNELHYSKEMEKNPVFDFILVANCV